MSTVVGIWIAVSGTLPVIVGLSARRRVSRLRQGGVKAWARAVPGPSGGGSTGSGNASHSGTGLLLRYTLPDGRVVEVPASARTGRRAELRPGQSVLLWYDPADPTDVLVYGRDGRVPDLVLVLTGVAFVLCGAGIAIFAP